MEQIKQGLVVEHVSKTFYSSNGYFTAVEDVSFSLKDGEFLVLLGPGRCGKTVLLNMIAGIETRSGGTILYKAHEVLEMITGDKDTKHMKTKLAVDFADLVYNGKWFTPLREALQAFAVDTQKHVTGTVKLKLYKGNIITSSVTSPESLYSENQNDATGFINLWGLPDKVQALREQGKL